MPGRPEADLGPGSLEARHQVAPAQNLLLGPHAELPPVPFPAHPPGEHPNAAEGHINPDILLEGQAPEFQAQGAAHPRLALGHYPHPPQRQGLEHQGDPPHQNPQPDGCKPQCHPHGEGPAPLPHQAERLHRRGHEEEEPETGEHQQEPGRTHGLQSSGTAGRCARTLVGGPGKSDHPHEPPEQEHRPQQKEQHMHKSKARFQHTFRWILGVHIHPNPLAPGIPLYHALCPGPGSGYLPAQPDAAGGVFVSAEGIPIDHAGSIGTPLLGSAHLQVRLHHGAGHHGPVPGRKRPLELHPGPIQDTGAHDEEQAEEADGNPRSPRLPQEGAHHDRCACENWDHWAYSSPL